jgi:hypothetical protein
MFLKNFEDFGHLEGIEGVSGVAVLIRSLDTSWR